MALSIFLTSCSSTTMIESRPPGAKVYLNGMSVGTTPYRHSDTKIVGSSSSIRLELDGYEPLNTSFSRDEAADVGAIIGGLILLVPFLWTMKYDPIHLYELVPNSDSNNVENKAKEPMKSIVKPNDQQSKADKLRELKKLLDEKIITQEEFEKEKKKILESSN